MDDQKEPTQGISLVWVLTSVVILVVLLLVGIVIYNNHNNANQTADQSTAPGTMALGTNPATPAPSPTVAPDQANQTDLQNVDTSLKNFDASSAQADTGLNDQQGDLSE